MSSMPHPASKRQLASFNDVSEVFGEHERMMQALHLELSGAVFSLRSSIQKLRSEVILCGYRPSLPQRQSPSEDIVDPPDSQTVLTKQLDNIESIGSWIEKQFESTFEPSGSSGPGLEKQPSPHQRQELTQTCPELDAKLSSQSETAAGLAMPRRVTKVTKAPQESYTVKESLYDLAMFVGMPEVGIWASFSIIFLLACTILMQALLCTIINDTFTISIFDEEFVNDMKNWRTLTGHSWQYVDSQSFQPLAKRICDFDGSVQMSSGVLVALEQIAAYKPTAEDLSFQEPYIGHWLHPSLSFYRGEMMCLIAIAIWLLNVVVAVREDMALAASVAILPVGNTLVKTLPDNKKDLLSIALGRKVWWVCLVVFKLVVSVSLGFFGIIYLVFTVDVGELLLNALAMQIVLELDDIIYAALCPSRAKLFISNLRPMRQLKIELLWMIGAWPLILVPVIFLILFGTSANLLTPQSNILAEVRHEICGGNVNFVSFTDRNGVVRAANVQNPDNQQTWEYSAMRQLIENMDVASLELGQDGSLSGTVGGMVGGSFSMDSTALMNVEKSSGLWNSMCVDMIESTDSGQEQPMSYMWKTILQDVFSTVSVDIVDCSSVKKYCSWDAMLGVRARQICPIICGCADPGSSLILGGPNSGCPPACEYVGARQNLLASRSCAEGGEDFNYLSAYVEGLRAVKESWPLPWQPDLDVMISEIPRLGCNVTLNSFPGVLFPWPDVCTLSEAWYFKPLTYACPVSCRCHTYPRSLCPTQCYRNYPA